jgi:hypothetical protein
MSDNVDIVRFLLTILKFLVIFVSSTISNWIGYWQTVPSFFRVHIYFFVSHHSTLVNATMTLSPELSSLTVLSLRLHFSGVSVDA